MILKNYQTVGRDAIYDQKLHLAYFLPMFPFISFFYVISLQDTRKYLHKGSLGQNGLIISIPRVFSD